MKPNRFMLALAALCFAAGGASAQQTDGKSVAPKTYKAYMVSDAHLDTQWNWDVQTTIREYIPRTLFQNLYLMERFPDYRFSFEGGVVYSWMKEYYPMHYERMKKYIASGQWHIAGASWDANDPNMPSAESFFRNILLGQEFYKKEFGVRSTDIFLPDCFGFGYTLPTIAAHSGLIGMSTQKLSWRNHDFYDAPYHKKNPFSWGVWYGIDGSSVIAAFDTGGYNSELPENVQYNERLMERAAHGYDNTCFRYYAGGGEGVGDKGNSGTVTTCRRLTKAINDPNAPIEIISATSDDLFKAYLGRKAELPSFDGELLMDVHATGCYTSQTAMKYYNRRNEELTGAAERASVAADWLGALAYDQRKLTEIWQRFIWHQFHDDLTGTSIPEAYTWSWNDELIALRQGGDVMNTAVGALSYSLDTRVKGTPVVVYNAVTYPVKAVVEAEIPLAAKAKGVAVYGPDGRRVAAQILSREGDKAVIAFAADVKSVGYAVYDVRPASPAKSSALKVNGNTIENGVYKLTLDRNGDIASLVDKRYGRELVEQGKAFRLAIFEGNPSNEWPAWEVLKEVVDKTPRAVTDNVSVSVGEEGPVRASLKVERTYGDSKFTQYITLTDGAQDDRIDIRTTVDWNSRNTLLKAEFPMSVSNAKAAYDLGIGFIERGNNTATAYEVPALKWADLTDADGSYGISVLNDCKYGWDKPADNTIRLTLIHTPSTEKRYPHQRDLDLGVNHFTYSIVGHKGTDRSGVVAASEQLNLPLVAYVAPKHAGSLGRTFSMLELLDSADRRACAEEGRGRRRIYRALLRADRQTRRERPHHLPGSDSLGRGVQRHRGEDRCSRDRGPFADRFCRQIRSQNLPRAAGRSCAEVRVRGEERARDAALQHGGLHDRRVLHLLPFRQPARQLRRRADSCRADLQRRPVRDGRGECQGRRDVPQSGDRTARRRLQEALHAGGRFGQGVRGPLQGGRLRAGRLCAALERLLRTVGLARTQRSVPQGCDDRAYRHAPRSGRRGQPALRLLLHVYGFSRYSRRCADGDAARKQERGGIRHDGFGQRHRRRASGERHFHPSGCEVTSF